MSLLTGFFAGAYKIELLRRDMRDKVQWAAQPFERGEQTKARIYRASDELRRSFGLVKAAWYENIGPYQYADLHNAWLELIKRRDAASNVPPALALYINERPIEPLSRAEINLAKAIAGLRKVG